MISVAGYLLALTAPLVIGLPVALAADWAETWLERLGLAWLAGSVLMALGLLVLGLAGVRYHGRWLLALLGVWVVASAWFGRARLRAAFQIHLLPPRLGWAAWVPKADALASSGSLFALGTTVYPDYPPLWPLQLFPFRAFAGGHYANHFLKLLPIAYLMAALAVVFVYLKKRTGPLGGFGETPKPRTVVWESGGAGSPRTPESGHSYPTRAEPVAWASLDRMRRETGTGR